MCLNLIFPIVLITCATVFCHESKVDDADYDFLDIYEQNDSYRGERFPQKYLSVDGIKPAETDLTTYIKQLKKTVYYFAATPNDTDANVAIGLFFTKALLKRTLLDYGHKIRDSEKRVIKRIINKAEFYVSHFIFDSFTFGRGDLLSELGKLFKHDDAVVFGLYNFNKHLMKKWIYSNLRLHEDIEQMDDITLGRFHYAELVTSMDKSYKIRDSDYCIAGINTHPLPIRYDVMTECHWNEFCTSRIFSVPSVAYALSHRLVYILGLHLIRRCYIISQEVDRQHMDIMCANMYREAVYLARRGFFYRDLFMEHIALCALLGYEEFFRYKWFQKVVSWIDDDGCMMENRNFELNRTVIYMSRAKTAKTRRNIKKMKRRMVEDECQHHQMALLMMVLSHAIRYTAHYM